MSKLNENALVPVWPYKTGGIPDEMFIRGSVPMTKAEIRAVTLAKAKIREDHVIWDIGAGTGSIAVEAALAASKGKVFAVEKEPEAVELIKLNAERFNAGNINICHGVAPIILKCLPIPDRVFIGGSGGKMQEIISLVHETMDVGGRIVINAVVLENLMAAAETLKECGFEDIDITQVAITKTVKLKEMNMFKSQNPIFIISAEKR